MRRFVGFVQKELYHIFRDPRTLLILFGMPLVQILLFGYAVTNEIREVRIAVLDQSKDLVTQRITERVLSSEFFALEQTLSDEAGIEPAFRSNRIKAVLHYEAEFAEKLRRDGSASIQILLDATDPNTAQSVLSYLTGLIQQDLAEQRIASVPLSIRIEPRMRYNPELKGVFLFVPGLITIILMLVSAMMTSISITREKELGTMEVLLVSPMRPFQIILAKVTPYVLLSLINASGILLIGRNVFGVPIQGSLLLLMAECVLFIIATLSLGILISTVAQTQQVALMLSLMGLMLPTILLSGFMFPIDNMPIPLQVISNIIPARWFIVIVKGIMLKGVGLEAVWKETLVLAGFAAVFISLSIRRFKVRLQ
ncbi:MAG: ABC transporter permease [Bacteroidia bacterium]|nr:ABC transporter permease [Bacteroidia bacterium]